MIYENGPKLNQVDQITALSGSDEIITIINGKTYRIPFSFLINANNYYGVVLSAEYESTSGGETNILISELTDASIIQITKETQPLKSSEFTFDSATGTIALTKALNQYETLFIIYSKILIP